MQLGQVRGWAGQNFYGLLFNNALSPVRDIESVLRNERSVKNLPSPGHNDSALPEKILNNV